MRRPGLGRLERWLRCEPPTSPPTPRTWYPGKSFTIIANNNSEENCYVQSAKLNRKPLLRAWITHQEIVAGGTLVFEMGPKPNPAWGSAEAHLPPSLSR